MYILLIDLVLSGDEDKDLMKIALSVGTNFMRNLFYYKKCSEEAIEYGRIAEGDVACNKEISK